MQRPSSLTRTQKERVFSAEEQERKRALYESISPRRRRFIDRLGYDLWDPFEAPKEPLDMRIDVTERTAQKLTQEFLQTTPPGSRDGEYARGVLECALGIVARQEKYLGVLDFCVWYYALLLKEKEPG
ncbi:MAG: hypothetical protein LBD42_07485 [Desulfovibrio sp.]|jgi:hypothetical protein|nr:hypothetical protein [Desulfovibrio sp.]